MNFTFKKQVTFHKLNEIISFVLLNQLKRHYKTTRTHFNMIDQQHWSETLMENLHNLSNTCCPPYVLWTWIIFPSIGGFTFPGFSHIPHLLKRIPIYIQNTNYQYFLYPKYSSFLRVIAASHHALGHHSWLGCIAIQKHSYTHSKILPLPEKHVGIPSGDCSLSLTWLR